MSKALPAAGASKTRGSPWLGRLRALRRPAHPELWWLRAQVLAPYDAEDARGLLKAAIRDPDPVVFLENEILYGSPFPVEDKVLDKDFLLPIGKAKVGQPSATITAQRDPSCVAAGVTLEHV